MNDGPGQTSLHENSLLSTAFQKDTEAQLFHYIRDSDFRVLQVTLGKVYTSSDKLDKVSNGNGNSIHLSTKL